MEPQPSARTAPSPSYLITALAPSASLPDAMKTHWREYLMEASELGVLMLSICLLGTLLYSHESPLGGLRLSPVKAAVLMGLGVSIITFLIVRSPFGRRTGAHFNPAITLTYLWLGRIHRWDALCYIAAQFLGAVAGVFLARQLLGLHLAADPVRYVVTVPGRHGALAAFIAEFLMAALLMGVVLFATNHRRLAQFSPILVALMTVFYFIAGASIAGFSVNPARSFSSALFAWIWRGVWIYFAAPCLGMVTAAAIFLRTMGPSRIYCAKIFHDLHTPCPFPCRFHELHSPPEVS
jgi:aquaporin Z